jgi:hydroxymethylbilane synthase
VHSAKDVPTDEDARLRIAAYLARADPRDALVVAAGGTASGLATLPEGSRVGTDSPRRAAFLRAVRPDLEIRPLHGNVDTRLRRLDAGEADALVLAVAGLARLGRQDRIAEPLPPRIVPPAPGQGAIAVQVRVDDERAIEAIGRLDDRPTRIAVEAERAFLRAAGGGCRSPIGALATVVDGRITLLGGVATESGSTAVDSLEGTVDAVSHWSADLAERLAGRLATPPDQSLRILVTRAADQAGPLLDRLREHGLEPVLVPAIAVVPTDAGGPLDEAMACAPFARWVVVTSGNGARSALAAAERAGVAPNEVCWAAVGAATASLLHRAGGVDAWLPSRPVAEAIGDELPIEVGDPVTLVRGSLADASLPTRLRERGAAVTDVVGYQTVEGPPSERASLQAALDGELPSAVVFASGSAVRGLLSMAGEDGLRQRLLSVPAVAIGTSSARAVREAGFALLGVSDGPSAERVATLVARLVHAAPTIETGEQR